MEEESLAEYRIIYCSDKITLRKVTQLHTERLRLVTIKLMCDSHPAGPVEIPDPALFYDPKVKPVRQGLASSELGGWEGGWYYALYRDQL